MELSTGLSWPAAARPVGMGWWPVTRAAWKIRALLKAPGASAAARARRQAARPLRFARRRMWGDDDVQLADDGGCLSAPDADQAGAFCLGNPCWTRVAHGYPAAGRRAGIAPRARGRAPRAGWGTIAWSVTASRALSQFPGPGQRRCIRRHAVCSGWL